jgi:hypothetical protein
MTIESDEFQNRLRVLLGLYSLEFTDAELARLEDRYRLSAGKERWDVRQYARRTGIGAREFRVLRGTGNDEVYRSTERIQADAVGAALNALEAEEKP